MGISPFDYENMKRRVQKNRRTPELPHCDEFEQHAGLENELHDKIEQELIRRRYFYVHSRTDKKTTTAKGVPDFIVAATKTNLQQDRWEPITFWIEVKRKGGKLSEEQTITKHVLSSLFHHWACVYSFEQFFDFIDRNL